MEFGMFTCGYQRVALERAFADAAAFGYDYIELWGGRPHAYAPDILNAGGAEDILHLSERYAVPVKVYTPEHNAYPYNYMAGGEAQWRDCVDYHNTAIRAGAARDAEYTLVSVGHGGCAPYPERKKRLLRTLRALAKTAEASGQGLVVETLTQYESNTCTTLDELVEALDAVDSPALFGMCDVAAPFTRGEDPAGYAKRLKGRMRLLHLVDSDGVSDAHLMPGDGVMPLERIMRDMMDAGYNGMATIELVTRYMHEPSRYAKLALERARALI